MTDIECEWLTIAQVSRKFGVPRPTLTWAIRHGLVPARKVDSRWYISMAEFRGWFETYRPHMK